MTYFKLSDLVDIEEIREAMEYDAKPRFNLCKGEEDTIDRFWESVFQPRIVHPEIEDVEETDDLPF